MFDVFSLDSCLLFYMSVNVLLLSLYDMGLMIVIVVVVVSVVFIVLLFFYSICNLVCVVSGCDVDMMLCVNIGMWVVGYGLCQLKLFIDIILLKVE